MTDSHSGSLHRTEDLGPLVDRATRPGARENASGPEQCRECREIDRTVSWSEVLHSKLQRLQSLVDRTSTVEFDPLRPYSTCLKYSFSRSFHFAELASRQEPDDAFFLVPALRAITEDIIFFRFLSKSSDEDREMVIRHLMAIDVADKVEHQQNFFRSFRPFQQVLSFREENAKVIDTMKDDLRSFWRKSGWPNLGKRSRKVYMPPIREMALKSDPGMLEVAYDFIYRLTSGEVHSTPRTLLRMGWGESESITELPAQATFSTNSLGLYHLSVLQVYGTYILCLWSELFGDKIGASQQDHAAFLALRAHLMSKARWPEMVTFEEMNIAVPDTNWNKWPEFFVRALYSVMMEEGFMSAANLILGANNREVRRSGDEASEQ